jgi:PleD family two-component response regulator
MGPRVGLPERFATELGPLTEDDRHWSPEELAAFAMHPGGGRILAVRPGAREDNAVESCLRSAGYSLGRLPVTREPSHLPQAAATFGPDVIYVLLDGSMSLCLAALEALSCDPRTRPIPLVALVPENVEPTVIEEAFARSGCDFFRLGATNVELLARTQLLVRLSGNHHRDVAVPPIPSAANTPVGMRLDLWDPQTQVYSSTYLRSRLPNEAARAFRYERELSLMAVRCPDAARREDIAAALAHRLRNACRDVDLIARYDADVFVMLLPETSADGVTVLRTRVEEVIADIGVPTAIGVATLGEEDAPTGPELLHLACARSG